MEEAGVEFNIDQIRAMIPHRYPFLLIDKVVNVVSDLRAVGIKNVTCNEPFFRGMPRKHLAMPGLLIVEAMAQTAAVVVVHTLGGDMAGKVVYLMTLQNVRFHHPVRPGDILRLHMFKQRSHGPISKIRGEARVNDALVVEAQMTAMIAGPANGL